MCYEKKEENLRGQIDYDTEKFNAVTILKNVNFSKGFYK